MPRDGSGHMSLANPPFTAGTTTDPTAMNGNFSDIVGQITNSVAADGQTPMTGDLNVGTHQISNVSNITASGAISAASVTTSGTIAAGTALTAANVYSAGTMTAANMSTTGTLVTTSAIYPGAGMLIGGTSNPIANATNGLQSAANGSTQIYNSASTPLSVGVGFVGGIINFYFGASAVGSISTNSATTAYNTTSDYRLKQTIGPFDGSIMSRVPVYEGIWRANPDLGAQPMILAHELAAVLPHVVTGDKDAVDSAGNPILQQVDYSGTVTALLAYAQSLERRIAVLESR